MVLWNMMHTETSFLASNAMPYYNLNVGANDDNDAGDDGHYFTIYSTVRIKFCCVVRDLLSSLHY